MELIVATAGHVDHGKTSLVRLLTGVDTDRLPEEKRRGLSIDLGFAYLPDPTDPTRSIGFVDVPGHEKFLKNMIAGVGSISIALLVVAADDGLMPQTREHLAVLTLMGQSRIIPVVTKTDVVGSQRVAEVSASIREYLQGQGCAFSELFAVSVHQQETVDQLRDYLFEQLRTHGGTDNQRGQFRMAVDRSFNVTGAGTVVTGTVLAGEVKLEDAVHLLGGGAPIRVRSIRAHNVEAEVAHAGQRCALNLSGGALRKRRPLRGDYLTGNKLLGQSGLLDVQVTALHSDLSAANRENAGFKHWTPCHLHIGTTSTPCRVALLESDILAVGKSGFARVYCDKAVGAVAGDRFVLRDQSARNTVAGGRVVDPLAPGGGRRSEHRLGVLRAMNHQDPAIAFTRLLEFSTGGLSIPHFIARYNCAEADVAAYARGLDVHCDPGVWVIDNRHWQTLRRKVIDILEQWHSSHPLLPGASSEQISRRLKPALVPDLATAILFELVEDRQLIKKGAVYRLGSWSATLDDEHEGRWVQIQSMMTRAGQTAPRVVEVAQTLGVSVEAATQLLNLFVAHGRLYRVSENRYYLPEQLSALARLCEQLATDETLTVASFRDHSAIGRNLVVELLEFFDRCQFTRRTGTSRRLLRSAESVFG